MKQAIVKYVETVDGKIRVTGLENFATEDEIKEVFGEEVSRVYFNGYPRMQLGAVARSQVYLRGGSGYGYVISVSSTESASVFDRKEFGKIINMMKAAGERLMTIVALNREIEEKVIVI